MGSVHLDSLRTEAHIWLTGGAEPHAIESYIELLAPEERQQYERYKVERARSLYLAARALARSVLSLGPRGHHLRCPRGFRDHATALGLSEETQGREPAESGEGEHREDEEEDEASHGSRLP